MAVLLRPPASAFGGAQAGRTGAGVACDLVFAGRRGRATRRGERLLVRAWRAGRMARGARRRVAALGEELLDDAVFQRMERHDGQPAPRLQNLLGGRQPALEFAQFVIHWMRSAWKVRVAGWIGWRAAAGPCAFATRSRRVARCR